MHNDHLPLQIGLSTLGGELQIYICTVLAHAFLIFQSHFFFFSFLSSTV